MTATLKSGARTQTAPEVEERVNRMAGGFATLGVEPGAVVSILMRNDLPYIELSLAAEKAGITAVPLNWHAPPDEIGYILRDSGSVVLFSHRDLADKVRDAIPVGCKVVSAPAASEVRIAYRLPDQESLLPADVDLEAWVAAASPWARPAIAPQSRLFYTSGTTGLPKGVVRRAAPPELAKRFAERAVQAHGLDLRPIRAVMTGPLYHSAPNVYGLNCARRGDLLVLQPRFDAAELLDIIERERITHLHAVPTMFSRLLDLPADRRARFDPSSIRAVVHGAAMCPPDLKRAMIEWWGPVFLEYYAATEVGIVTAATSAEWLARPGTVGRPPPGVEIRIVDEAGVALAPGEVGEVTIRSDVAPFISYLHLPEATTELRRGEWVTLGDVGHQDVDGYLWLSDRKKDMAIIGGVNVFPAEIEAIVGARDAVFDCVVFGVPDRDLGEALVAVVELHPHATDHAEEIQEAVRARLGRLKVPKVVRFVPALAREDSGKIARRKVKAAFLAGEAAS